MQKSAVANENWTNKSEPDKISIENNECNLKNVSPYMTKDMIAAAGFNVETPIVNAIIGNLSGTLPTKKNEAAGIKCQICDCELSSNIVLSFHVKGSKHQKKLKSLEILEQLKETKDKGVQLGISDDPNAFKCGICSLTVNSAQQLGIHLSGAKHKKKAAKINCSEPEDGSLSKNLESNEDTEHPGPSVGKKKRKDEPRILTCDICNVLLNSQTQYSQHLLSKRHISKAKQHQRSPHIYGRGKLKILRFKRGEGQSSKNDSNSFYQRFHNVSSSHLNTQMFEKLLPYSNFITKTPYNKGINTDSFRQSSGIYQNRF